MTTEYPVMLTICVPDALKDDGNQFSLVIGEQAGDRYTFGEPNEFLPTGEAVHVKGTRVGNGLVDRVTAPVPLEAPDHAPDADLAAAERARAVVTFSGPATATTISVRIGMTHEEAMADMGLGAPS